jgi:phosphate starvation-inducible membrane PsiE
VKYQVAAATLAVVVVAAALASGQYRRAAAVGAGISALTALASLFAMARSARRPGSAMKGALVVMVVAFLVRIVLVALGAAVVAHGGENVVAFIVSFFVPYFAFSAIEIAYLHSMRHTPGPTA